MRSAEEALRFSKQDPEAHYAHALVLAETEKAGEAVEEFESAARLRPDDYFLWLELGRARDQIDDDEGALSAFKKSVALAPFYAQPHWELGNLLLRMGRDEEAFGELRKASASDLTLLPAVADLAWSTSEGDAAKVVREILPQTDAARLALARFLIEHAATGEAIKILRGVDKNLAHDDLHALVKELLDVKRFEDARDLWLTERADEEKASSGLFDGGFENGVFIDDPGFGWRPTQKTPGVRLALDAHEPRAGARSLLIEFEGNSDPASTIIRQIALVKPHTHYRLRFSARTSDLVTGCAPAVFVSDADNESVLALSDSLPQGTSGWKDCSVALTTGDATRAILIGIKRPNCASAPVPIFGRAWFDDFALE